MNMRGGTVESLFEEEAADSRHGGRLGRGGEQPRSRGHLGASVSTASSGCWKVTDSKVGDGSKTWVGERESLRSLSGGLSGVHTSTETGNARGRTGEGRGGSYGLGLDMNKQCVAGVCRNAFNIGNGCFISRANLRPRK